VRVERRPTAGPLVEVWVGLSEILTRGLNAHGAMPGTGLSIKGPASLSDTQRIRQIQFLDEYESTRRMLRLIDVSATGYGFEVGEKESMGIGVGDLVGMRLSDEEPCVLGRVVRRVPGQVEGQVVLGVLAISNSPQALTLARTQRQNRPDDEDIYIYVPGCDDSGAQDAFLVPEKILQEQTSHDTILGDDLFTIQFNRVRRKGRGWALAGFEILDAKRVSDPPRAEPQPVPAQQFKVGERTGAIPIPNFELVNKGGEDAYANAWDREVSRRML
jgi:hypothetical protein